MSRRDNTLTSATTRVDCLTKALATQLRYIAERLDRMPPSVKRSICGCTGDSGLLEIVCSNLDRQFRGESAHDLTEIVAHAD